MPKDRSCPFSKRNPPPPSRRKVHSQQSFNLFLCIALKEKEHGNTQIYHHTTHTHTPHPLLCVCLFFRRQPSKPSLEPKQQFLPQSANGNLNGYPNTHFSATPTCQISSGSGAMGQREVGLLHVWGGGAVQRGFKIVALDWVLQGVACVVPLVIMAITERDDLSSLWGVLREVTFWLKGT